MADSPGRLGQMNTHPGTGNTLTFTLNDDVPHFQLVAQGFLLSACTVTVLPVGDGTDAEAIDMTGKTKTCSISDTLGAINMRSVTVAPPGNTGKIGCYQA